MVINRTVWHLNSVQINDMHQIELLEIERFEDLTVFKQNADV